MVSTYLGLRTVALKLCVHQHHLQSLLNTHGRAPSKESGQFRSEVGWSLGMSNRFPGDADAAGLATTHGEQLI